MQHTRNMRLPESSMISRVENGKRNQILIPVPGQTSSPNPVLGLGGGGVHVSSSSLIPDWGGLRNVCKFGKIFEISEI